MNKVVLKEIILAIAEYLLTKESGKDLSLVSGKTGHLLFFGYAYDISGDKRFLAKSTELFDHLLSHMPRYAKDNSLANGISGFLSVLALLEKRGLMDLQPNMLNLLTTPIFESIEKDTQEKNYDLLHGMLGKGFALSHVVGTEDQVENIIGQLLSFSQQSGNMVYWHDYYMEDETAFIDLGFAHGISAIAVFLARHKYLRKHEITNALKGILEVFKYIKRPDVLTGLYPGSFVLGQHSVNLSRLGWCYGDLCVVFAKLAIARALKLPKLQDEILEESLQITQRLIDDSGVIRGGEPLLIDRGFCHGTAGLALLFRQLGNELGHPALLKASDYWLNLTLDNNKQPQWWLFPRQDNKTGEIIWAESNDALDGITGVGLSLCSLYNGEYNWTAVLAI
jgi:lantibiotic biosynthesis protein